MIAAFDFPLDPLERANGQRLRGCFLQEPSLWLVAKHLDEVGSVIDAAYAAAQQGAWVLGGLRYEAACAFDSAMPACQTGEPLAEFAVFECAPQEWPPNPTGAGALCTPWLDEQSATQETELIEAIREHIRDGHCYQVNLTTRLHSVLQLGQEEALFHALHAAQPGGFSLFLRSPTESLASVSPELFFDWRQTSKLNWRLAAQPMKGTAARGANEKIDEANKQALMTSAKERAENLMIVDLLRNDMSRVAELGTVQVPQLFELHALPTVWQMTSTVLAQTRAGMTLGQVFAALFPCGSVTGAPKLAAMQLIAAMERLPRGYYCGALGMIQPGGTCTFNVPIRTVQARAAQLSCGIGSGITLDSQAPTELAEWRDKASFLAQAQAPIDALETLRIQDGQIVRLEGHLTRMQSTAAHFGLLCDVSSVRSALQQVADEHTLGAWRLRATLARDGQLSTQCLALAPTTPPVVLHLASVPMVTTGLALEFLQHKTTRREAYAAAQIGKPVEAFDVILWNEQGDLTECSFGNLALQIDDEWLTPPLSAGLLPGVYRAELLASGRLREARLPVELLKRAQALAFFNSLRGWLPARLHGVPTHEAVL